jgi:hypothetical protein
MSITINAALPVAVAIFGPNEPVIGAYRLWFKNQDDIISTLMGTGTAAGPVGPAAYPFQVHGVAAGSQLSYYVTLDSGNGDGHPYSVVLTLSQQGQPLADGVQTLTCTLTTPGETVLQGIILFAV